MTPQIKTEVIAFFSHEIETWEGGFQAYPQDVGNWANGVLIGTNRGVTPAALARHRSIPLSSVTRAMMVGLSLEEAAEIGYLGYYLEPGFDKIPWCEVTSAWVDAGWGSGPRTAIKHMQRIIGAGADGVIGPETQLAFDKYLERVGMAQALRDYVSQRIGFFEQIVASRPDNGIFLNGWKRRANAFRPSVFGMPDDWNGYPEDLWRPGYPTISCAKSWEIQIEDPRTEPLVITPDHAKLIALCEKFAIDLQDYGIAA